MIKISKNVFKNKKSLKKKSFKRKTLKNKSFKRKTLKNKFLKKFIGGAGPIPQVNNRLALFFDNENSNFNTNNIVCPNVIKIKVFDSISYNKYDNVMREVKTLDSIDNNNYEKFIINDPSLILYYDGTSGIKTLQLKDLLSFLDKQVIITDMILDFDRTFTLVEGIFASPELSGNVKHLLKPKVLTQDELDIETQNYLNLIMGGVERRKAMKQFLIKCIDKGIHITILTNNSLPIIQPTLLPNILSLILDRPDTSMIDIITTKVPSNTPTGFTNIGIVKYERINKAQICNPTITQQIIDTLKINLKEYIPTLEIK